MISNKNLVSVLKDILRKYDLTKRERNTIQIIISKTESHSLTSQDLVRLISEIFKLSHIFHKYLE